MKVLFTIFSSQSGSFGSLTRLLALAKEFSKQGSSISFCASGYVADVIEKKQFKTHRMPESTLLGLPKMISNVIERKSQKMEIPVKEGKSIGSIWFLYYLAGMLNKKYLKKLVQSQIEIVKNEHPDIIITEIDPGAYLTAIITKTPLVTMFAKISLYGHNTFFWKKTKKVINSIIHSYGLDEQIDPEYMLLNEKVFRIIPSIPELDGSNQNEENIYYTGNLLEPINDNNNFIIDKSKRYIFVYLGTGSVSLDRPRAVLPETFKIYPNVVCYVAAQSILSKYNIENVNFVPYVPSDVILPYCDLVICHGGLNTITQSIEFGVPLLLFPGPMFERRYNAEMIVKNGAGAMGEISNFTVDWIRYQYEKRSEFDKGVTYLKKQFSKYKGVKDAVKNIKCWLQNVYKK